MSGGESQRIRLATQIGSQLVNVLYILDEPSIGLHQRDNDRLIKSLKHLRDIGNTVVVVEHDQDMMMSADYVVDMGPKAGRNGGNVIFAGTPEDLMKANTMTADYLRGVREIEIPKVLREGNGTELVLKGAKGNNLKNVTVHFPLRKFICVTGVSGSGKSTLINETLQPILSKKFYRSLKDPLPYDSLEGIENIDKVVQVDQSPIGRTPRSNPATYTGIFSDIRNVFVQTPEAKLRGYKPGRFSFNTAGGRCEACGGNGYKTIEMNFLPDVYIPCEECHGKRYDRETLEVRFKGKSIADVLDMTINQAVEFFENIPSLVAKLKVLQDVGLGYLKVGQSSTTLSGGESQRVKLATELSKRDTGKTLYILDEPTTGLHFEDIRVLLIVLQRLVDKGNTVIVIEHNLDVIKVADYLIEMGPDGGKGGGQLVFAGTPEELAKSGKGYTVKFLKPYFSERMQAKIIGDPKAWKLCYRLVSYPDGTVGDNVSMSVGIYLATGGITFANPFFIDVTGLADRSLTVDVAETRPFKRLDMVATGIGDVVWSQDFPQTATTFKSMVPASAADFTRGLTDILIEGHTLVITYTDGTVKSVHAPQEKTRTKRE